MDATTVKMSQNERQSVTPVRAEGGWAGKGGPDTELQQPHISTANVSSTNSCQVDRGHYPQGPKLVIFAIRLHYHTLSHLPKYYLERSCRSESKNQYHLFFIFLVKMSIS